MKQIENIKEAFKASLDSKTAFVLTFSVSVATLIIIALSSNIEYSIQMISAGMIQTAIRNRLINIQISSGYLGVLLTIFYSLMIGSATTNFYIQLKSNTIKVGNLAGILPAFLIGGCASCGLGLLAILGFSGALAILPFQGNLVKVGGILLIVFFLSRTGNPKTCNLQK